MLNESRVNALTSAQKEILSHWRAAKGGLELPRRSDINPGQLRAHLSSISMIEIDESGDAWFRLVGSKLLSILGPKPGGRNLRDFSGEAASIWSLGLKAAAEAGRPMGGILERQSNRHSWLRLPLATGHPGRSLILCHDVILKSRIPEEDDPFRLFSGGPSQLAA
ncbi:PAS domain-containing protein [Henriciella sp. AS95]|uniref:PAS domain-containing protein n=1 Tax=Henriciella sp. AS95 TaxID=3135782 RepID=UPI00317AF6AC